MDVFDFKKEMPNLLNTSIYTEKASCARGEDTVEDEEG